MTVDGFYYPGEFAKLCGISRDTLEYYGRIGLLPPCKKEKNGYGLYSPEQVYSLQLIHMLKTTGCSLKEIKTFLYVGGVPEYQAIIDSKREQLEKQRAQIDKVLREYDYYEHFRRTTLDLATPEMRIVLNPQAFYIFCTKVDPEKSLDAEYRELKFREHVMRCNERAAEIMSFPVGSIYPESALYLDTQSGISGYCSYCNCIPKNPEDYTMAPSAYYLTYLYKGTRRDVEVTLLKQLLEFAIEQGYRLVGDIYIIPFTKMISNRHISMYDCRVFVAVEKL